MQVAKDSVFSKGLATGGLTMFQSKWETQIGLGGCFVVCFCVFGWFDCGFLLSSLVGGFTSVKGQMGQLESECDWGTLCEIPK